MEAVVQIEQRRANEALHGEKPAPAPLHIGVAYLLACPLRRLAHCTTQALGPTATAAHPLPSRQYRATPRATQQ